MSSSKKKLPRLIRPDEGSEPVVMPDVKVSQEQEKTTEGTTPLVASQHPVAETSDAAIPETTTADLDLAKRRAGAHAIVRRYAAYSGVGGIIPIPFVSVMSITAVIVRMVKKLSDHYGVPFEKGHTRTVVIALLGGMAPIGFASVATSSLGAVTTSALTYVVPVGGLVGLAVSSATAVGCTHSVGRILVDHFETGATLRDLSLSERS